MPLLRLVMLALLCLPAVLTAEAQTPPSSISSPDVVNVSVEGAVQAPGQYTVPANARIGDAVIAAKPDIHAYVLGAALIRDQARTEQIRLKAGLLYDLQELGKHRDSAIATSADQLANWLQAQPITGRVPGQQLEPRLLRLRPELNPEVRPGDQVIYPTRPDQIKVIGAVKQSCELPQVPAQDANAYLLACPASTAADHDNIYVIQPDGVVQPIGIALWNRSSPQPLAPGAILYVPIAERAVRTVDPEFNRQFADFLATQLLPAPGANL